jgi:hypothetical protein
MAPSALWSLARASRDCASFSEGVATLLPWPFLLLHRNYLFMLYAYYLIVSKLNELKVRRRSNKELSAEI